MEDLNARRANSSVVMFCLFLAKQGTKQCSESEKRNRADNKLTIFVVCANEKQEARDRRCIYSDFYFWWKFK
jgi:hypothetical protein